MHTCTHACMHARTARTHTHARTHARTHAHTHTQLVGLARDAQCGGLAPGLHALGPGGVQNDNCSPPMVLTVVALGLAGRPHALRPADQEGGEHAVRPRRKSFLHLQGAPPRPRLPFDVRRRRRLPLGWAVPCCCGLALNAAPLSILPLLLARVGSVAASLLTWSGRGRRAGCAARDSQHVRQQGGDPRRGGAGRAGPRGAGDPDAGGGAQGRRGRRVAAAGPPHLPRPSATGCEAGASSWDTRARALHTRAHTRTRPRACARAHTYTYRHTQTQTHKHARARARVALGRSPPGVLCVISKIFSRSSRIRTAGTCCHRCDFVNWCP